MTSRKISAATARAAANTIARLRHRSGGIDWQVPGIEAALVEHADMADESELVIAMIRAAMNPVNRTPAIIAHPGPHWREAEEVRYAPPKVADLCAECQQPDGPNHPRDHVWVRQRHREPTSREKAAAMASQAKEVYAQTRGQLCRHGVKLGTVKCAVCDLERPDATPLTSPYDPVRDESVDPVPVAP
jgi:hypothetical protein